MLRVRPGAGSVWGQRGDGGPAIIATMTFDELRACLETDGWPVEALSEVTLGSRFRAGDRVFPVFVHRERADGDDTEYATFAVIPFARLPPDESGDVLADRLLEINREMNMAKFSVDEEGDIVLSVEYPLADLDPSEVRDAIDVLSFYAEKYRSEMHAPADRI
jgi:hypothetical protein